MNILIVDDDIKKINAITNDFMKQDLNNKVFHAVNCIQATNMIMDMKDELDLIILDWTFPLDSFSKPKYGIGKQVINVMKLANINTDTIICAPSIEDVDEEKYPFIKGSIQYVDIVDVAIRAYNILGKPIEVSDGVPEEYVKELIRTKVDTGYKRRRSSEPWWMK